MHPRVVHDRYRAPRTVALTVSQNTLSASGEGFTIKDPEDRLVFKMDGHFLSIRDHCVLQDPEGSPILSARKKAFSTHERWEVVPGEQKFEDENLLFVVRKASIVHLKTHLKVFIGKEDKHDTADFEVKGNFLQREAQIYHGDTVIAEVKRKFSVGNVLLDKDTFEVVVHPNVDQAFIAALVIIMDRIHDD